MVKQAFTHEESFMDAEEQEESFARLRSNVSGCVSYVLSCAPVTKIYGVTQLL